MINYYFIIIILCYWEQFSRFVHFNEESQIQIAYLWSYASVIISADTLVKTEVFSVLVDLKSGSSINIY